MSTWNVSTSVWIFVRCCAVALYVQSRVGEHEGTDEAKYQPTGCSRMFLCGWCSSLFLALWTLPVFLIPLPHPETHSHLRTHRQSLRLRTHHQSPRLWTCLPPRMSQPLCSHTSRPQLCLLLPVGLLFCLCLLLPVGLLFHLCLLPPLNHHSACVCYCVPCFSSSFVFALLFSWFGFVPCCCVCAHARSCCSSCSCLCFCFCPYVCRLYVCRFLCLYLFWFLFC
ncbi:hypothetical protein AOLI_G00157770 [Acnodon oligacanthus]